jgi:hypothetical protein
MALQRYNSAGKQDTDDYMALSCMCFLGACAGSKMAVGLQITGRLPRPLCALTLGFRSRWSLKPAAVFSNL